VVIVRRNSQGGETQTKHQTDKKEEGDVYFAAAILQAAEITWWSTWQRWRIEVLFGRYQKELLGGWISIRS